jgi:aspartate/methionine/tyrosine aminotransferase
MSSRPVESPYIQWVKSLPPVIYNLAFSGVKTCPIERLELTSDDITLDAPVNEGWPPLVEHIAARYGVSVESVVLAPGTTGANHLVFAALIEPGDHVIVERPVYDPLYIVPEFLGADITFVDRRVEDSYRIDVDRLRKEVTDATRMIVLSNLHNPTGAMLGEEDLHRLAELADDRQIYVLVDEVYLEWLIGCGGTSAATVSSRLISTSSLTKAYGLSGLRAGWALATPTVARRGRALMNLFDNTMAHIAERLAARAFEHLPEIIDPLRESVRDARATVDKWVNGEPQLSWVPPTAGTIGFIRTHGVSAGRLAAELLEKHDTLIVPGAFFGDSNAFRVGLGMPSDVLIEGLRRVSSALRDLEAAH